MVIAGAQVGVLMTRTGPRQLNKKPDEDSATAQLMSMAGTTHSLVNGLVVIDTGSGRSVAATDIMKVTMRPFTEEQARAYVRRFEPFDCSGSYRIEDQAEMPDGEGFLTAVEGEHDSGVKGLPLPLLRRMIIESPAGDRGPEARAFADLAVRPSRFGSGPQPVGTQPVTSRFSWATTSRLDRANRIRNLPGSMLQAFSAGSQAAKLLKLRSNDRSWDSPGSSSTFANARSSWSGRDRVDNSSCT